MSITVQIAGREYCLNVNNADEEELYRRAAEAVNKKLALYQQKFLGKPETDILSFVAFNVCLTNLKYARAVEGVNKEAEQLHSEIDSYLADIEK